MSESTEEQEQLSRPSRLRTVLVLGRTSNLPTVWTNVLAGWLLAGGFWDWQIAWLALAVSALYLGGMTLNDAFDIEWDRKHAPERPVPSGVIGARAVWMLGWGWMLAGVLLAWLATDAGMPWVLALVAAILLYDWIHKKWSGAMWVMGACRALVYLVAASGVAGEAPWMGIFALALGMYVAAISLLARGERASKRSERSQSAEWLANGLLIAPLLIAFIAVSEWLTNPLRAKLPAEYSATWIVVAVAAGYAVWSALLGRRRLSNNIGHGVTTLLAGIVLVDALFVALVDWRAALICLVFLPVVRLLQKHIPAT